MYIYSQLKVWKTKSNATGINMKVLWLNVAMYYLVQHFDGITFQIRLHHLFTLQIQNIQYL